MTSRLLIFVIISCISSTSFAQIGGTSIYSFMNIPTAARTTGLGGSNVSLKDGDPTLIWNNPGIMDSTYDNAASISYNNYIADINAGSALFSKYVRKIGMISAGLNYMSYGQFNRTDITGAITGDFKAKDYLFQLGWAEALDSVFTIGANMKLISSIYDQYSSTGLALDVGVHYHKPMHQLSMGLLVKSVGYQLSAYNQTNREVLPFEIQYGITKRLSHAPLRINVLVNHLERWDLTNGVYYDSSFDEIGELVEVKKIPIVDNILRHLVGGIEFVPSKSFHVQLGYNYMRRQELKLTSRAGMAGISWGVGMKISKFRIGFSHAGYHFAGATNQISLSTNLNSF